MLYTVCLKSVSYIYVYRRDNLCIHVLLESVHYLRRFESAKVACIVTAGEGTCRAAVPVRSRRFWREC